MNVFKHNFFSKYLGIKISLSIKKISLYLQAQIYASFYCAAIEDGLGINLSNI